MGFRRTGARHGLAVTNGTAALEVTLAALGIGPGDEVIVPDFTFVATASAVLFVDALPVLVDVQSDSYCLDPQLTEAAITSRTKAIIAVHMGGHPADLDALKDLATRKGLALVEDCAHSHAIAAAAIRMKLGGSGSLAEPFPPKPKRMRWRTYRRLYTGAEQHEAIFFGGLAVSLGWLQSLCQRLERG